MDFDFEGGEGWDGIDAAGGKENESGVPAFAGFKQVDGAAEVVEEVGRDDDAPSTSPCLTSNLPEKDHGGGVEDPARHMRLSASSLSKSAAVV